MSERYRIVGKKAIITGMIGVYLTAAELSKRGFIVSPTSRGAEGADLLVTDQECQHVLHCTGENRQGWYILVARQE